MFWVGSMLQLLGELCQAQPISGLGIPSSILSFGRKLSSSLELLSRIATHTIRLEEEGKIGDTKFNVIGFLTAAGLVDP